jgi:phosphatidylglycerophosphatase A
MRLFKAIASVLGIGYVGKGGGTLAALFYCIVWLLLPAGYSTTIWQVILILVIIALGIWSGNVVDAVWGKDSSKVVIDEVAGMAITLLYVPQQIAYLIAGLVAFRFFDIVKPLGIKKLEKWPRGWGVMADDVLAGLYALIVVQLMLQFKLFLK